MEQISTIPKTQLTQDSSPQPTVQPTQKKFSFIMIMLLGVLCVIGLVIIFFLFNLTKTITQPANTTTQQESVSEQVQPIETPSQKRLIYTDPQAGFSFQYPQSAILNNVQENSPQIRIIVDVTKMSDIPEDLPMMMGRNDALAQKAQLAESNGVDAVKIDSLFGYTSTTLSVLEVCSIFFERKLTFYPGDYRVNLSVIGPTYEITSQLPEYFHVDPLNCGEKTIWKDGVIDKFLQTLSTNQGKGIAQEWYNTFDDVIKTIELQEVSITQIKESTTQQTYRNEALGFEISFDAPYRVLTDEDSLSAYPQGVALLYTGGQAYDLIIEVWNTQAEYEKKYSARMSDLTSMSIKNKFVTILNNTGTLENQKIIQNIKILE